MGKPTSSTVWIGRFRLAGGSGRRMRALAAALLAAGALAAGCGSARTGAPANDLANRGSGHATAPSAPATPVPTVTGGPTAGGVACVGWPTNAHDASLPVSIAVVSVERCVNGAQTVPGKGLWTSATLQRADSGLTGLIDALRQPSVTRRPGTVCPALAIIPPQVVLISASGQKLIPRLPVSGCGLIQSRVLAALNELRWQTVSVRLIAEIPGRSIQTVSGGQPR